MTTFFTIVSTAGVTAALFGIVIWLSRNLILTRLRASVEHEFNVKIEGVRAERERDLAELQHQLDTRGDRLAALRADVLATGAARRSAIDLRRTNAVDRLWAIVVEELNRLKPAAQKMAIVNFENTLRIAETSQALREMFASQMPKVDAALNPRSQGQKERPYISETAWSLFLAYDAIVTFAFLQLKMIVDGINMPQLLNYAGVREVIAAALPHQREYIERYGPSVHAHLLDELETKLIAELRRMLRGEDEDEEAMHRAKRVIAAADQYFDKRTEVAATVVAAGAVLADAAPLPQEAARG